MSLLSVESPIWGGTRMIIEMQHLILIYVGQHRELIFIINCSYICFTGYLFYLNLYLNHWWLIVTIVTKNNGNNFLTLEKLHTFYKLFFSNCDFILQYCSPVLLKYGRPVAKYDPWINGRPKVLPWMVRLATNEFFMFCKKYFGRKVDRQLHRCTDIISMV